MCLKIYENSFELFWKLLTNYNHKAKVNTWQPQENKLLLNVIDELCMGSALNTEPNSGLGQDCSNAIANALKLLHSCIKPSTYGSGLLYVEANKDANMIEICRTKTTNNPMLYWFHGVAVICATAWRFKTGG